MISISKDMVVSFRYVMYDHIGNVLENTTSSVSTRYLHGSGTILAILQNQMEGLQPGQRKKVLLSGSSGLCNGDYLFDVIVDTVRPANEKELILGYPLEETLAECNDDCNCYKN